MTPTNFFDPNPQPEEENFKDQPHNIEEEVSPDEVQSSAPTRPQRPTTATVQLPQNAVEEDVQDEDQDEVETDILTDARLRLEQGRLYEMVLNHDVFQGVDADPKAIKSVQKEIRAYAQERMEIMLGMRQEKSQEGSSFPLELFPFNSLEVETLKALAAAATKGASRDAEPLDLNSQQLAPARKTLNPIGSTTRRAAPVKQPSKPLAKPVAPVKRAKVDNAVQRILEEEGVTLEEINQVFDPNKKYLTAEELAQLTSDQVIERNRIISLRNKQVANPAALPMPTEDQIHAMAVARATQAASHPQMQKIMGLLDEAQKKKGL